MHTYISIETIWTIAISLFTVVGIFGTTLAIIAWKFYQKWNSQTTEGKEKDTERKEKLAKEESELRETVLQRYKSLYELTQQQYTNDMAALRLRVDTNSKEMATVDEKYRRVCEENERFRQLNLELQNKVERLEREHSNKKPTSKQD